jgi:hypothetical protein
VVEDMVVVVEEVEDMMTAADTVVEEVEDMIAIKPQWADTKGELVSNRSLTTCYYQGDSVDRMRGQIPFFIAFKEICVV